MAAGDREALRRWLIDCEQTHAALEAELADARRMLDDARRTLDAVDAGWPEVAEPDDDPLLRDPSPGIDPRVYDLGTDAQ